MLFLISKDEIQINYEDYVLYINYEKTRSSKNFNTNEVRFDKITISSYKSLNHIKNFLNMLYGIIIPESPEKELSKYIWKEDRWIYCKTVKRRNLDTIYFNKKEEVYNTLEKFMNDNEILNIYKELEVPYKKIFLFHGLPGTGKTSLIRALASKFDYNISIVKNVMDMDDNSLEWMLGKLKNRSFLVLEDIDCIFNKRDTNSSKTSISFSGLLNMLDGVSSYEKLVIFITTNHIEYLDHAFRRRIDMFVEFTYASKLEIIEMFKKFFKDIEDTAMEFYEIIKNKKVTINTLEKYFIDCLNKKWNPCKYVKSLDIYNQLVSEKSSTLYL